MSFFYHPSSQHIKRESICQRAAPERAGLGREGREGSVKHGTGRGRGVLHSGYPVSPGLFGDAKLNGQSEKCINEEHEGKGSHSKRRLRLKCWGN